MICEPFLVVLIAVVAKGVVVELVEFVDVVVFEKSQHQLNKQAAFFNFELLKYEFKYGLDEAPLVLAANWSSNYEEQTIELILDYKFNYTKSLSQCNFMILMPMVSKSNGKDYRISLDKSEPNA
ncbi:unnamed protein product, partial [Brachionus calyciflorus]